MGLAHQSAGPPYSSTQPGSLPPHSLMIQDAVCTRSLELLEAKDSLKVILALLRLVHVCGQVAV